MRDETWQIWTDGSCHFGVPQAPKGMLGYGGWAAIVEHGSDGVALHGREQIELRGRAPRTTNVRMEIHAAVKGLGLVPDDERALLHTDCTTLVVVRDWWSRGRTRHRSGPDLGLWVQLANEFDRVDVELHLLGRRSTRDEIHRRAHVIAGAEARGALRSLPPNAAPFEVSKREKRRQRKAATELHRVAEIPTPVGQAFQRARLQKLVHDPACIAGRCVETCPVWLEYGAFVYARSS